MFILVILSISLSTLTKKAVQQRCGNCSGDSGQAPSFSPNPPQTLQNDVDEMLPQILRSIELIAHSLGLRRTAKRVTTVVGTLFVSDCHAPHRFFTSAIRGPRSRILHDDTAGVARGGCSSALVGNDASDAAARRDDAFADCELVFLRRILLFTPCARK